MKVGVWYKYKQDPYLSPSAHADPYALKILKYSPSKWSNKIEYEAIQVVAWRACGTLVAPGPDYGKQISSIVFNAYRKSSNLFDYPPRPDEVSEIADLAEIAALENKLLEEKEKEKKWAIESAQFKAKNKRELAEALGIPFDEKA